MFMRKYEYKYEDVAKAVKDSLCWKDVLQKLNIPAAGGNWRTIQRVVKRFNIDTSHFDPYKAVSRTETYNIEYYFNNRVEIQSFKLLKKLINEGYKEYKCEVCGIVEWNDKPITLQLHHIDGDHLNNALENLQVICPNCHSQTNNFRGKANKVEKPKYYCKVCGKELRTNAKTGMCPTCALTSRRKPRPTNEEIISKFNELNGNYCATGRYFNVSDNCIRKWIKNIK